MVKRTQSATRPIEDLKKILHAVSLRSTPARLAVLRVLSDAQSPLSHGEVAEQLNDGTFDRVTLFRVLNDFAEAGIVTRADVEHTWRFELNRNAGGKDEGHPHFVCVECGVVLCLSGVRVDISKSSTKVHPLPTGAYQIQVKGRCERCAA